MRNILKFKAGVILTFTAICTVAVFGVAAMLLWNALLPPIFGLPELTYVQALGILVLSRVLFGFPGGFADRVACRNQKFNERIFHRHGNKLREKWMNMNEEERSEFMAKERDFFKEIRSLREFFDITGEKEYSGKKEGNCE